MEFKLWSELYTDAKKVLKPDLGLRSWGALENNEKENIWSYLQYQFFKAKPEILSYYSDGEEYTDDNGHYFLFYDPNFREKRDAVQYASLEIHHRYKVRNYTKHLSIKVNHFNCCLDFYNIFMCEDGDVVLELLSLYCKGLIQERPYRSFRKIDPDETEEKYFAEKKKLELEIFIEFATYLNDVFADFGLNIYLSNIGFIPRQDEKIISEIFEPVLQCLSDEKWKEVNTIFSDAFIRYRENTPHGFSTCVTLTVSAVQAFLQILIKGKTGKGEITKLISQGQKENLISNDMFTKEIFTTIESILMRERQETGDAHPKKDYASDKNAKMVLNLSMVFIQHCIIK